MNGQIHIRVNKAREHDTTYDYCHQDRDLLSSPK